MSKNLSSRLQNLRKHVGGYREVKGYEEVFGLSRGEKIGIASVSPSNHRILSELEFVLSLSKENGGAFDACADSAITLLETALEQDSVLTNSVCNRAEELILPASKAAKEYKLILAGHAHIDMNWMWSWNETVAVTLATFRTVLDLMVEYPDFCFSQSQASVYRIVEEFDPDMMSEIKGRIAEGRWEVTASNWVETDKNMPKGESLLRHIKSTKTYLRDTWGVDPSSLKIDFSPDTFGHSANLPEIDAQGGVEFYYHCRALDGKQALYRWRGHSGKELLCYREQYWYNSGITPRCGLGIIEISKRQAGLKTGLIVYGIGDHGGGPTRCDVERAIEMMKWRVFPEIKFGTFREFFDEAQTVRDLLPLEEDELNFVFAGCYTTQSRIKLGNRRTETALLEAEAMSSLAALTVGAKSRGEMLEKAWRDVLFTHFHDILTGSCVQDAREYAMGLFANSMAAAQTQLSNSMSAISKKLDTSAFPADEGFDLISEGAGAGFNVGWSERGVPNPERGTGKVRVFTVFNPTAVPKKENVEITVWDWTGDTSRAEIIDADGTALPFVFLNGGHQKEYWTHQYHCLIARVEVPALGYITLALREKETTELCVGYMSDSRSEYESQKPILENEYIRAKFDKVTGRLISLIDKATETEFIKQGESGGFNLVDSERAGMEAWRIGRYLAVHEISKPEKLDGFFKNDLRSGFSVEYPIGESKLTVKYSLDAHAHAVKAETQIDWHKTAGEIIPLLTFCLPAAKADAFGYGIPCGYIERTAYDMDVPGIGFGAAIDKENAKALSLMTDCKYGYRGDENGGLTVSLINTSCAPDPYPERGIHDIKIFFGIYNAAPATLADASTSLLSPLTYCPTGRHPGELPSSGGLFEFSAKSSVVSAVLPSDDASELLVRLYECGGSEDDVSLKFEKNPVSASAVDLFENELPAELKIDGKLLKLKIAPNNIVTLKIKF